MAFSICVIPEFNNGLIESEEKGPLLAKLMKNHEAKSLIHHLIGKNIFYEEVCPKFE